MPLPARRRPRAAAGALGLGLAFALSLLASAVQPPAARGGALIAFDRRDVIRAPQADFTRAADVDGDGDLDLLAIEPGPDDLSWWENTTGRGDAFVEHAISLSAGGPNVVAPGDADGDGDVDVFALERDSNRITLWTGDGAGGFAKDTGFRATTQNATFIDTGDVGGDGTADLFVLEADTRRVQWWPNAAAPGPGDPVRTPIFTVPQGIGAEMLSVADVDGDGLLDVLTANRVSDRIGIWRQAPGAGGAPEWTALLPGLGLREESVIAVRAGDADGDGDADLFALRRMPYVVYLWTQGDDGTFTRDPEALARSPGGDTRFPWNAIDLGDIDGDGALDFATSELEGFLCWYRNPSGASAPTPTRDVPSPGTPTPTPATTGTPMSATPGTPTATPTTGATAAASATAMDRPTATTTAPSSDTATPSPDPATAPWEPIARLALPYAIR